MESVFLTSFESYPKTFRKEFRTAKASFPKMLLLIIIVCAIIVIMSSIRQPPQLTAPIDLVVIELKSQFNGNLEIPYSKINDQIHNWTSIPMPKKSHFGFDPPRDRSKWERSQRLATSNTQVILKHILKYFNHPYDFLDGDVFFREIQKIADIFLDSVNQKLNDLTASPQDNNVPHNIEGFNFSEIQNIDSFVPGTYEFRLSKRAPVVSIGYYVFDRMYSSYYHGKVLGHADVTRRVLLNQWKEVKDKINTPFIAMYIVNENAGPFSTLIPNRTHPRGTVCCEQPWDKTILPEFFNDENTLMVVTNQHSNYSHPKILTLPRGLPIRSGKHAEKVIWDAMRMANENIMKQTLLHSASSSWHTRPQIVSCVAKNFDPSDFEILFASPRESSRSDIFHRITFYQKLASSRFGLGLPGLGYDCFRTWEYLMMGTIPVIERGVGLDRMLWRLPALLVDDFAYVTPELLRSAYVEALYRLEGGEFEFERLKQSFWLNIIQQVSVSKSIDPMMDKFPMKAEDPTFTRPLIPYECAYNNTCGRGTKRIPLKSC